MGFAMARQKPRKLRRQKDNSLLLGIAWYDRDQWSQLKQVAADVEELDDTYEDWVCGAERLEREFARKGMKSQRVSIDVGKLLEWCKASGRINDSAARAYYTSEIIRGVVRGGSTIEL
jgi:hypothetical protein